MNNTKNSGTEMNILRPLDLKKLATLDEIFETFACDPPKDREKAAEEKAVKKKTEGQSVTSESFSVRELDDRYVISPVQCRGEWYKVDMGKDLLDGGKSRTQDKWVNFLQKSHSELHLASGQMIYSILTALYNERKGSHKNLVAEIHEKLKTDFEKYWMMTSTRIKYTPNGLDEVIHGYRSSEEYSLEAAIVGPNNFVTPASGLEDSIEALLGTRDLALLEKVSGWVSGKKPSLWRVNSKPQQENVGALVFGIDVDINRFSILADNVINDNRPARGVAASQIFFSIGNGGGK